MKDIREAKVRKLRTDHIQPNPHNPRMLFDPEPMQILQESISKLGVIVLITVYQDQRRPGYFILLDGERRWRCVNALKLSSIPAIIVAAPTDVNNILTMFHIHNLRVGWELMPTAMKLQTLMEKLQEKNERKLAELTKLSISQIRRCKILLSYPTRFQNMMLAPLDERLKSDFFIDLQRIRGPALKERFPPWIKRGDVKCIEILLAKYERRAITNVTEFRQLAEIYRGALRGRKLREFYAELDRFFEDPELGVSDIHVEGASFAREYREISRSANRLLTQLKDLDTQALSSSDEVVGLLRAVSNLIQSKLEDALLLEPSRVAATE